MYVVGEQFGLYVLNTKVAPAKRVIGNMLAAWRERQQSNQAWGDNARHQGFAWQGHP